MNEKATQTEKEKGREALLIFLLAAGNAERHNGGNKPMLVIQDETLFARVCRQLPVSPVLVTHRDDIPSPAGMERCCPMSRRWVTETLYSTRFHWSDTRNVVLLGDVYYTDGLLHQILASEDALGFYGDDRDIFALTFSGAFPLACFLADFIDHTEKHPRIHGNGKLGAFRRWLMEKGVTPAWHPVNDGTQDFDSPQEHARFVAALK